ncbi:MAG: Rrf2 family transcriptional regulator [Saprospiraceae bacterium]|jgi:Rrf2 family iron-sulfur cluster assembly transcriptional regulator|nr:Rrf2 family transcriptional regulator [Saprospiraceae bacterium]
MFSKTCEYGIRSCIYICCQTIKGKRPNLQDVARMIESPEAFTAKIIRQLVKKGIVQSSKGPGGGFNVDLEKIKSISLYQIIEVFDGNILNRCSLGLKECSEIQPCPFHHQYKPVKEQLINLYASTTLFQMTEGYTNGNTFLKG